MKLCLIFYRHNRQLNPNTGLSTIGFCIIPQTNLVHRIHHVIMNIIKRIYKDVGFETSLHSCQLAWNGVSECYKRI